MRILLNLLALLVPRDERPRWREEWRAELQYGGRRMLLGALPDAWAMRRLASGSRLPSSGSRGRHPFHALDQDVRYGMRTLAAAPGFVLGVVLSLTLGIGGNIAAFTFINAAVFRPFPGVQDQHELVRLRVDVTRDGIPMPTSFLSTGELTAADGLELLRSRVTTVDALSAHVSRDLIIAVDGQPSTRPGAVVSSNYFDVLGVRPAVGRFFSPADDQPGGDPVAVISHAAWQRLFNGDPGAMGGTITVNGTTVHVIGVAAEHFIGVRKGDERTDVWIPLGLAELTLRDSSGDPVRWTTARNLYLDFVGRRSPGTTVEAVAAEMQLLAAQLQVTAPPDTTYQAAARRVWLNDPAESAPEVVAFMIIPLLVLAIACVNAANLLLARAARQTRDWTVRLALGASRWRIVRQVLAESTVLATVSAALGLVLANWAIGVVARQIPVPLPIDVRVVAFTLVISLGAALAFSLAPALSVIRRASRRAVTSTAPVAMPRSRGRSVLVALQAALSLGLLTTGAQFTNTVFADNPNAAVIPSPERLVIAPFDLDPLRLSPDEQRDFYQRLITRTRQIPGVAAAGVSTPGLVTGVMGRTAAVRIWTPATPAEGTRQFPMLASPGALDAIAVPLLAGRQFDDSDAERLRQVIVNEPFARKFFHGPALGRTFRLALESAPERSEEVTIVGIAGGIMRQADSEGPLLYSPTTLEPLPARALYVRTDGTQSFSIAALSAAVRAIDARVPVSSSSTLAETRAGRHRERQLLARGAAALGLVALVLAAGGLYGVVSYVVSLRRQEVGIRLALGAEARSIVVMITRQALTPALIGAVIGLLGAAIAGRVVQSNLYGSAPTDLRVFAGSTALLLVVLFAATIIPARRAAGINPLDTLRTE
jgi:putative ABC transport system permease protein